MNREQANRVEPNVVRYKRYLIYVLPEIGAMLKTPAVFTQNTFDKNPEGYYPNFIRWIDTEWQEVIP